MWGTDGESTGKMQCFRGIKRDAFVGVRNEKSLMKENELEDKENCDVINRKRLCKDLDLISLRLVA